MQTLVKWTVLTLGSAYAVLFYFSTESAAYRQKTPIEEYTIEAPPAPAEVFPRCTILSSPCNVQATVSTTKVPEATVPIAVKKTAIPPLVKSEITKRYSLSPLIVGYVGDGWETQRRGVDDSDQQPKRRGLVLSFLYPLASYTFMSTGRDVAAIKSVIVEFDAPAKSVKNLSLEFYLGAELVGMVPLTLDSGRSWTRSLIIPINDINIRGKRITEIRLRSSEVGTISLASILLLTKD